MNEGVKLEDDAEAVLSPSSNRVDPINDRPPTIEYDVSMTRPDDGSVLFSDYKTDSYVILDPSSGYSLASSVSISTKEADGTRKAQVTIDEQAKDTAGEATGGGRKRVKATNKNERPEKELPEGVRRCKNQFRAATRFRTIRVFLHCCETPEEASKSYAGARKIADEEGRTVPEDNPVQILQFIEKMKDAAWEASGARGERMRATIYSNSDISVVALQLLPMCKLEPPSYDVYNRPVEQHIPEDHMRVYRGTILLLMEKVLKRLDGGSARYSIVDLVGSILLDMGVRFVKAIDTGNGQFAWKTESDLMKICVFVYSVAEQWAIEDESRWQLFRKHIMYDPKAPPPGSDALFPTEEEMEHSPGEDDDDTWQLTTDPSAPFWSPEATMVGVRGSGETSSVVVEEARQHEPISLGTSTKYVTMEYENATLSQLPERPIINEEKVLTASKGKIRAFIDSLSEEERRALLELLRELGLPGVSAPIDEQEGQQQHGQQQQQQQQQQHQQHQE